MVLLLFLDVLRKIPIKYFRDIFRVVEYSSGDQIHLYAHYDLGQGHLALPFVFAGNYATSVICKNWFVFVLMARKHNLQPIHLISIYCISKPFSPLTWNLSNNILFVRIEIWKTFYPIMGADAWGVIGVNSHIPNIFLNAGLAMKGEVDSIEENQEHQNKKKMLWYGRVNNKGNYSLMLEILKKMFEAKPERSTIVLKKNVQTVGAKY